MVDQDQLYIFMFVPSVELFPYRGGCIAVIASNLEEAMDFANKSTIYDLDLEGDSFWLTDEEAVASKDSDAWYLKACIPTTPDQNKGVVLHDYHDG